MKLAMQYLAPHMFVLTNGITECCTPSRLHPLQAWCNTPSSSFVATRELGSACSSVSGCEGRALALRSTTVCSFSLDQLRQATTLNVAVDEALKCEERLMTYLTQMNSHKQVVNPKQKSRS